MTMSRAKPRARVDRLAPMLVMVLALALLPAPVRASPSNTFERTLANGLRIIVREDHRAPTAVHMVLYRVGSVDESGAPTGVAHMLEHLMFKGTPANPGGSFSREVAAMGGRENAFTTQDYTAYYQQIPAGGLATVMRLEADRMTHLEISDAAFESERKVVIEERRLRVEDQPIAMLHEQLTAQAFLSSPVRTPVIGWMGDLEAMDATAARDWYRRWYTPGNAIVIVAGDVHAQDVFEQARQTYGGIEARGLPPRKPLDEPAQRGRRTLAMHALAQSPYLVLAWRVPKLETIEGSDEPFALAMLAAVLDGDENARLNRALVRERRIASAVGVSYEFSARGPVLFTVSARPAGHADVDQLASALRDQIGRIASDGVDEDELERIRIQYLAARIYQRDSVFAQAMEVAGLEALGMSWRDEDRLLERIRGVTPAQIQAVAARYFGDDGLSVATLWPSQEAASPPRESVPGVRH